MNTHFKNNFFLTFWGGEREGIYGIGVPKFVDLVKIIKMLLNVKSSLYLCIISKPGLVRVSISNAFRALNYSAA